MLLSLIALYDNAFINTFYLVPETIVQLLLGLIVSSVFAYLKSKAPASEKEAEQMDNNEKENIINPIELTSKDNIWNIDNSKMFDLSIQNSNLDLDEAASEIRNLIISPFLVPDLTWFKIGITVFASLFIIACTMVINWMRFSLYIGFISLFIAFAHDVYRTSWFYNGVISSRIFWFVFWLYLWFYTVMYFF